MKDNMSLSDTHLPINSPSHDNKDHNELLGMLGGGKESSLLLIMSRLLLVLLDEAEKQLKLDFSAKKQVLGIQKLPNNHPESGFILVIQLIHLLDYIMHQIKIS